MRFLLYEWNDRLRVKQSVSEWDLCHVEQENIVAPETLIRKKWRDKSIAEDMFDKHWSNLDQVAAEKWWEEVSSTLDNTPGI